MELKNLILKGIQMKNNRLLKNLIIYPTFQYKLVILTVLLSLITPLVLIAFQYISFSQLYSVGTESNLQQTHPYFVFLNQFQNQFYKTLALSLIVSFVLSFILGILFSHRVAGPLVKMIDFFNKVAEKPTDDGKITFRQGDMFQELPEAYNKRFK
ncbi:MAG: hypothetical protein IPM57_11745 [Oligoflexia bacterium]|nr:hypothetical protein [Oligoflexia bacterium]